MKFDRKWRQREKKKNVYKIDKEKIEREREKTRKGK